MNIVSCPNGHYFNRDKYTVCPICSSPVLTVLSPAQPEDAPAPSDSLPELKAVQDRSSSDRTCPDTSTQSTITDNSYRSEGEE